LSGDGFKPVAGGKEVNCMITTQKITRTWVEDIEKIEVTEPDNPGEADYVKRYLTIWTTKGEKVELILEAESDDRLEFKKPDDSWLTPKVYKGRTEEDSSVES
jgi:hypothetical protein